MILLLILLLLVRFVIKDELKRANFVGPKAPKPICEHVYITGTWKQCSVTQCYKCGIVKEIIYPYHCY